ncbi:MAG: DUF3999 family protein [Chloroflexi bacterium]|nr:DUF3999 family protein [Chloroflexota bacterium]
MKSSRLRLSLKLTLTVAGLATSILVVSQAFADFSLTEWRYVKPINLPSALREEGLVELLPDSEVFANSTLGLVDLRIIAGDGAEVPYKAEVSRAERQQTSISVALRDKGYVPGKYTTFVADLGREGVLHNKIEIRTPSSNFRRTAIVEASDDGATWTRIAEQQVFDFTVKEIPLTSRDTRVSYTDSTARYLRVQISDEGEGPLEIAAASVFFAKETLAQEVRWPVSILGASRDTDRRVTLVELDLGAQGLPSHGLAIDVPNVNFYREVDLETSSDREEWRRLASRSAIYAYDTPKFVGDSLALTYPETTDRYIRLTIHDEDNPALSVQAADVWGLQRRLLFSADPGQSYKLYYGNTEARRPSYDIERVFPYLATEDLPEAALGAHVDNPQFVEEIPPAPPPPPVSERLPWLFPAVVSVAAGVVGLILFGVLRQARKVLPPPAP